MIEGPSLARWVVGFVGLYMVHRDGRVFNRNAMEMSVRIDRYGYANIRLSKDGRQVWKKVHRLVCEAWHGPCPENHECGHLDGDKQNNRHNNLAWVTRSQNERHKFLHGTRDRKQPKNFVGHSHCGARNGATKLTDAQAVEIRARIGESCRALGREFGVSKDAVNRIHRNMTFVANGETPTPSSAQPGDA